MWRRLVVVAGLALLASGCMPQKAPTTLGYHKQSCSFAYIGLKGIECGTMVVEETRGKANGRTVALPVVIVRAQAADKKADPVIFLHGGPGGEVVSGLPFRLRRKPSLVTDDRDWIFFDQRGTGKSTPSLDCGEAPLSDAGVTSDAGVAELQACGRKLAAQGIDLTQYNSAVIAQDIRDIRQALGVKTYNLYGGSYGTRVAMAVMQHDPADLRAVVLNSTWPPEANATAPLPGLVSREVRQVLAYCAADSVCNGKYPDLAARFDTRLRQWLTTSVSDKDQTYTADAVGAFLLDQIYSPDGASALPTTIDKLLTGDYKALGKFVKAQAGYTEGQFFTTLCREEFGFEDPAALDAVDANDPIAVAVARDTRRFFAVCQAFATGKGDAVENQALVSDIPTLMLSADIDAGCPAELSEETVKGLSKGRNYFFPNRTHTIAGGSTCAKALVAQFLKTADANVDASCIKTDRPKFPFVYDGK
ncbi:alpha/beta hydrolase [Asticcacaulis sp. AC460]|uniref:alpha/beta fold hydrolase n=1 Tax=Asticcacaulis sp. AC460 TaxID=1282360 RepID=UPI0003C3E950|nr:alpha/beta fold hydrolase [Asticcacaulis sp. AC460]ESQ88232.1 alpha/beta hydrolase [Asticcacaulis sp. AC460]